MKTTSSSILVLLFLSVFFVSQSTLSPPSFSEPVVNVPDLPVNLRSTQLPEILRCVSAPLYGQPYGNFDPLNEIIQIPLSLVYEPLIEFDEQFGEIVPVLAYQWVVTNDSKHWTFYLRDDVLFHDGSRFNASSVRFSFERAAELENKYKNIPFDFVEIINEFQVTVHFTDSYAPFLLSEAQLIMIISPNSF